MRIKYVLVFGFIILFQTLVGQSQKSALRYLNKANNAMVKNKVLSYNAKLKVKEAMQYETLEIEGKVRMRRNKSDIFFGYDLWIETRMMTSYYSLGKFYRIDHFNKNIYPGRYLDPAKVNQSDGPFNQGQNDMLFDVLLHPDSALIRLMDNKNLVFTKTKNGCFGDTITITARDITGQTIWNTDTLSGYKTQIMFDRKTKLPIQIIRKGLGRYSNFYWDMEITPESIDEDSIGDFFYLFRLPMDYKMIGPDVTIIKSDFKNFKPIKVENFDLLDYKGNKVTLSDFQGKVVLLDFWYSSCAPCIKASPYIEKIAEKYADSNVVVLGMNPIDNVPRIEKHYDKWKLTYNSLVCTSEVKNSLGIGSYPSFVIIDKNGMMIFKESGFSRSLMTQIEKEVKSAIR